MTITNPEVFMDGIWDWAIAKRLATQYGVKFTFRKFL